MGLAESAAVLVRLRKAQRSASRHGKNVLEGFPFDRELLSWSALYRRSRALYLAGGGRFEAALVSSARTLSSAILIENRIEYTPLEREIRWAVTDRLERKSPETLARLKPFIASVFHEQNHRILWRLLPPAPRKPELLRRYLNFAEALVITTDMALGDELGPTRASLLKGVGVVFDPGTRVRTECSTTRVYRNYLQACLHATYLNLEMFDRKLIAKVIPALYSNAGAFARRAVARAANLNREFITRTNLVWQRKHRALVLGRLSGPGALELDDNPLNNVQQYVLAERWFDMLG